MTRLPTNTRLGAALVVLAVGLFIAPAFFPVQATLVHDTGAFTFDGPEQFEEEGITVIQYDNMSDRGQELYVRTLEKGGEYHVSPGQGASDFNYLTGNERQNALEANSDQRPRMIVIERPEDADLPPADEAFERSGRQGDGEDDQRRQQVQRYELMETATEPQSLGSVPQLLRLGAAVLAVLSLGLGGYLCSVD